MSATSKTASRLLAALGGNMQESMAVAPGSTGPLPAPAAAGNVQYQGTGRSRDALTIEVGRIVADPDQPRKEFEAEPLALLAESLKARGQLQPIRVRWSAGLKSWVVISGERRWRAAQMAGLATLACVEVKGELAPDLLLEDQIVENCLREDLKPLEAARAFDALMQMRGLSIRQAADYLQTSHGRVQKAVELLKLPGPIRDMVEREELAPSVAIEIGRAPEAAQVRLAERARDAKLTKDQAVEVVKREKGEGAPPKGRGAAKGPPKPRTFRGATGKVTVELKRAGLPVSDLLREILDQVLATERSQQDAA